MFAALRLIKPERKRKKALPTKQVVSWENTGLLRKNIAAISSNEQRELLMDEKVMTVLYVLFFPISFQTLEIRDATKDDQGAYECRVTDHSGNTKSRSEFVRVADRDEPFLRLAPDAVDEEREVGTAWGREHGGADELRWVVQVEGDPRPTSVVWHDPRGRPIDTQADPRMRQDYSVRTVLDHPNMHTRLTIKRVGLETAGSYRLVVRTKLEQDGEEKEEGKKSRELRAEETLRLTVNSPAKVRTAQRKTTIRRICFSTFFCVTNFLFALCKSDPGTTHALSICSVHSRCTQEEGSLHPFSQSTSKAIFYGNFFCALCKNRVTGGEGRGGKVKKVFRRSRLLGTAV